MSSEKIQPPRRRFALRFSLRSLLIAITLLCIGLSWWMYRARRQSAAVKGIRDSGGWVYYDYQRYDAKKSKSDFAADSPIPKMLIDGLGVDFFHNVDVVSMVYAYEDGGKTRRDNPNASANISPLLSGFPYLRYLAVKEHQLDDAGFAELAKLKGLEEFFFWDADQITDKGVTQLRNMPRLRTVHLSGTHLSDLGLATLAGLPCIDTLSLQQNEVSDEGVKALRDNPTIEVLWLGSTGNHRSQISDASIPVFASMPKLRVLELQRTQVTVKGLRPLQGHAMLSELYLGVSRAIDKDAAKAVLPKVKVSVIGSGNGYRRLC
ncbi:MAG: leucine-rich repeat domain-containing protein [Pirellulaceae bacterium]